MSPLQYALVGIAIWVLLALAIWGLVRGASLGEDDIEEVFPEPPPVRSLDDRHEWRGNSAKAHHAD